MSKKWYSGPPPSVGWWPASFSGDSTATRWWNGRNWSAPAYAGYSEAEINRSLGTIHTDEFAEIKWQHRPASWPKRSRT
jgi:hypothetical protein